MYTGYWGFAWFLVAWRITVTNYMFLRFAFTCVLDGDVAAIFRGAKLLYLGPSLQKGLDVLSGACSAVFNLLITWPLALMGAAEIAAMSVVVEWYKHLSRICRRANSRFIVCARQLMLGEDAGQGSRGSRGSNGGKGSKGGSKKDSKAAAAARRARKSSNGGSSRTAGLQETATGQAQVSPAEPLLATSNDAGDTNSSSSSSSTAGLQQTATCEVRALKADSAGTGYTNSSKGGKAAAAAKRARKSSNGGCSSAGGLQERAACELQVLGKTSVDVDCTNSSSSSNEDDDEVLALLTLLPAASANKGNDKNQQCKPQPANKGKQRSTEAALLPVATAAAQAQQPVAAAAAAAKPSLASSSNNGRPAAVRTGKGSAAVVSQCTAAGKTGLSQRIVCSQA
jgi:hypothetical protein